jgi:YggT family protein
VTTALLILADTRGKAADYVQALVTVYWIILIAYILSQWYLSFGGRVPYARWSSVLLGFLRDVSEPYLRIFRRILPSFGPLDLSPIIAILVLFIVGNLVANVIRG